MPFTLFDSLINNLIQKDVATVDCRAKTDDFDSMIYDTMEKRGTTVLIGTKLLDEHKRIIGFVGIDYCGGLGEAIIRDDESAIREIEKIVFREAQALSTLLYVKIAKDRYETQKSSRERGGTDD